MALKKLRWWPNDYDKPKASGAICTGLLLLGLERNQLLSLRVLAEALCMSSGVQPEAWVHTDHSLVTIYYFTLLFNKTVSQPLKHVVSTLHLIVFG